MGWLDCIGCSAKMSDACYWLCFSKMVQCQILGHACGGFDYSRSVYTMAQNGPQPQDLNLKGTRYWKILKDEGHKHPTGHLSHPFPPCPASADLTVSRPTWRSIWAMKSQPTMVERWVERQPKFKHQCIIYQSVQTTLTSKQCELQWNNGTTWLRFKPS